MRFLRRRLLLLLAVVVCGLAAAPAVAADAVAAAPSAPGILREINAVRARHGLRPLRLSRPLTAAATAHTRDMGRRGYFAHDSFDHTPFWKRVRRFYPARGYRHWMAGENLLWGTAGIDARRAVRLWLGSPGHRRNMLSRWWREIGISSRSFPGAPGTYRGYDVTIITTDFGTRTR